MKTIKEIRKEYGFSNSFFAKVFGYKNVNSYNRSSGKKVLDDAIVKIVNDVEIKITSKLCNEVIEDSPNRKSWFYNSCCQWLKHKQNDKDSMSRRNGFWTVKKNDPSDNGI